MNEFIENPNLPESKVSLAICGRHNDIILDFIKSQGIELIFSDNNTLLDNSVMNHADLCAHHTGGKDIIVDCNNHELYKILREMGMNVLRTEKGVKSPYPFDCALNCFKAGNYLFCNYSITDKTLLTSYKTFKPACVKQGYCKCSTLLLNNNCFITDDITIFNKGKELSFNCLLIEKGDVFLKGYDYGFIGGACAKIDKSTVLFFGDITKHRSFNQIDNFIKSSGMSYIYSKDFPLTDIGGIIPLKQKISVIN